MQPWKIASVPEEAGISSKGLLAYLDAVKASGIEHHSVLVIRNGMLACKMNFAPYDDHTPHVLYSLSKSFCSAAAGFAVQEGLLSWDSRVADILSDKMPAEPSEWLQQVTLHHLLTMGSGLDPRSDSDGGEDWMKAALAWECTAQPGTRFHYNSRSTYLVSAMVQRVTGMTIRDYLMPRLFEPLGIPEPEWDLCPLGVSTGGWGLHLSTDSIARFGLCLLQKGMWQGKQLLPLEWYERATAKLIDNERVNHNPDSDWEQGYGYQFWRTRGNRFRAMGKYGQTCMVSLEQNMVVAITAGMNNLENQMDMDKELDLLHEYLFPAAQMEPGTPEEQQLLQKRLAELSYPWPVHVEAPAACGTYANDGISLQLTEKTAELTLPNVEKSVICAFDHGGKGIVCPFSYGGQTSFELVNWIFGAPKVHFTTGAGWSDGKLTLLMRSTEAPYMLRAEGTLTADGIELKIKAVGFESGTVQLKKQ